MELLYFISGILSVGVLYGIRLLQKVKSSHTELLARYQSQSNISSIRYSDLEDEIKTAGQLIADVQAGMEKDQYESVSEINKKIQEIGELTHANNSKLAETTKVFNKNLSDAFNEIQQTKKSLKALGQDPNFLSRY